MKILEKKMLSRAAILAFSLALAVPLFGSFLLPPQPEGAEHRDLAKWPESYRPQGYDAYFTDHIGFRKLFLQIRNVVFHHVFGEMPASNVIVGKEGWMYLNDDDSSRLMRRSTPFSPQDVRNWRAHIEHRREILRRQGVRYVFVVVPEKQTIYPEYVPDGFVNTRQETFLQAMQRDSLQGVRPWMLDLTDALRARKVEGHVFFHTDTHWTSFGAYVGYQAIMQFLQQEGYAVEVLASKHNKPTVMAIGGGDLAQIVDLQVEDENYVTKTPRSHCIKQSPKPVDYTRFRAMCNEGAGRVVVIGDSFSVALRTFFAATFRDTLFWQTTPPSEEVMNALVRAERPEVIVEQVAERFLFPIPPHQD